MTFHDHLRVVREGWKLIALAVVLGVLGAIATFLVRPPEYTATVSLYVSAQTGDTPQQAFQGAQLSEQRVKSYNELVTGDRVLGETIRRLGLPETPDDLVKHVSATSGVDSVIIRISATDTSAAQATAIANTVGVVVTEVVADLERPAAPNSVPPVAVRVVQPAPVPDKPSSAGLRTTLALGLLAGLVVGVGAAFLRNSLDTSVKSLETLAASAGAPNLGTIAFDPKIPDRPLVLESDPGNPRAEAFRQLRTNLQFVDVDHRRKVVLVTSSVPGEGKTTTVANLAVALSSMNVSVLVVEADLRRPRLAGLFGLESTVGLTHVLTGRTTLTGAVQPWNGGLLDVLAGGPIPPNPAELLGSGQMQAVLDEARAIYDVVLIDVPPLLPVTDAAAVAPMTDGAMLVCRFGRTTRQQVVAAMRALQAVSVPPLGTVLTMVPDRGPAAYGTYSHYYADGDPAGRNPWPPVATPPAPAVRPNEPAPEASRRPDSRTHALPREAPVPVSARQGSQSRI